MGKRGKGEKANGWGNGKGREKAGEKGQGRGMRKRGRKNRRGVNGREKGRGKVFASVKIKSWVRPCDLVERRVLPDAIRVMWTVSQSLSKKAADLTAATVVSVASPTACSFIVPSAGTERVICTGCQYANAS